MGAEYDRGWDDATRTIADGLPHLKITPNQREFVKASMRACVEYAAMTKAGYKLSPAPHPTPHTTEKKK